MGFWSKLKKAVKKVWAAVKATVRAVVKIIIEIVVRIINLVLVWLPVKKKLRMQVFILRDETGKPLVSEGDLIKPIEYLRQTLEDKFRVKLLFYGDPNVQILPEPAPKSALDVECDSGAGKNEWGAAGEYFANNLAGWTVIPINLGFPITVYVVRDIAGKIGCSLGPLTDYVTVSKSGTRSESTLAHEIGHCCSLLHRENDISNLMFPNDGRSNGVTGWQKFVFRNSRHCTFW
jgi:hypothetical protein